MYIPKCSYLHLELNPSPYSTNWYSGEGAYVSGEKPIFESLFILIHNINLNMPQSKSTKYACETVSGYCGA